MFPPDKFSIFGFFILKLESCHTFPVYFYPKWLKKLSFLIIFLIKKLKIIFHFLIKKVKFIFQKND